MKKPSPETNQPHWMPVRFRRLGDRFLVTNDAGQYAFLERQELNAYLAGSLAAQHPAHQALEQGCMIHSPGAESALVDKIRRRSDHLFMGPSLHIVILTLRCNQTCVYCHASRKPASATGFDMDLETAEKVLDRIFESPSPELTIEFQGGEPTLNFEVLRFFVEDAYSRADLDGRSVYFSLVSNLGELTAEQIDFLVDHGVMVCSSIDGPPALHDRNRRFGKRSAHKATIETIRAFASAYQCRDLDAELAQVSALATVSRAALDQPEALVDEYVRLGYKVIHLRPLNPFGMGKKVWAREGYSAEQFVAFWTRALDHIIELNRTGVEIMEKMASLMLTRILTDINPNYMDLRSPCGAGIGQLAYSHDGRVYTCDEGRMVGAMGDDIFCIGDVHQNTYEQIIRHPGVRSLCVASCVECLPGCSDCAYAPYCGVCPVYNYVLEGDLVARCPDNDRCKIQKGMFDYIFLRLTEPGLEDIFRKWTETRDRSGVYRRHGLLDKSTFVSV
jgi:His-Xaa-Ser system radical SAM maturase HxsB